MDAVLQAAGSCGRYQIIHVGLTQLPRLVAIWSLYFMMFGGFDPGWRCVTHHHRFLDANSSTKFDNSSTSPVSKSKTPTQKDKLYVLAAPNETSLNVDRQNTTTAFDWFNSTCWMIDSCDEIQFNPSSKTIITEFQLICDDAWIFRAILFVHGTGCLFGPLAGGQLGEVFGRRVTLYGCIAIIGVSCTVAIFSTDWIMFVVCFFFVGAAGTSANGISNVISKEFLTAKWRGYFSSIPVTSLALCVFVLSTAVFKNWIHIFIVTIVLSITSCVGFCIIPESPRWLMVNGHNDKAKQAILTIARINKRNLKPDDEIFLQIRGVTDNDIESKRKYTFLDLYRNSELLPHTLKFSVIFFVFEATYLVVTFGIKSLPGDYYTNSIEACCVDVVFVLVAGPLCNCIGRRHTGILFSCIGALSSLGIVGTLSAIEAGQLQSTMVKMFAYGARSSSQCLCVVSVLFSTELYPTVVRNVSSGMFRCCSGVAGLVVPFLIPDNNNKSLIICFSILCVLYLANVCLFPSLPETNKQSLTDHLKQTVDIKQDNVTDRHMNHNDTCNDDAIPCHVLHTRKV